MCEPLANAINNTRANPFNFGHVFCETLKILQNKQTTRNKLITIRRALDSSPGQNRTERVIQSIATSAIGLACEEQCSLEHVALSAKTILAALIDPKANPTHDPEENDQCSDTNLTDWSLCSSDDNNVQNNN